MSKMNLQYPSLALRPEDDLFFKSTPGGKLSLDFNPDIDFGLAEQRRLSIKAQTRSEEFLRGEMRKILVDMLKPGVLPEEGGFPSTPFPSTPFPTSEFPTSGFPTTPFPSNRDPDAPDWSFYS